MQFPLLKGIDSLDNLLSDMVGPEKLEMIKQGKSVTHGAPTKRNISAKVVITAQG